MSQFWTWPWRKRRLASSGARHTNRPPGILLCLEILEDRLLLSSAVLSPAHVTHQQWRKVRYSLNDVAVVRPSASEVGGTSNPSNVTNQAMESSPLIGLDKVFAQYPYRGQGYSVAVIDTGIDYKHPDLGGAWGKRVIAGWNFVKNNANPMDDNGHGTHVAGIIGSSDGVYRGIAPKINLIALKVLSASGSGTFGAVEDALKWVASHQTKYNIVAVNLSLGTGNFVVNPYSFLDDEFAALKSKDVFVSVAAGNNYYANQTQPGLAFPAVSSQVVSVGAVWDGNYGTVKWLNGAIDYNTAADHIASFSQRSSALDLLAPAAMVTSTYKGGGFKTMAGTSMAAPVVAAAAALLHQQLDALGRHSQANQHYILSVMQSSGATVHDGNYGHDNVRHTNLDFKRLDLAAAMRSVSGANTAPSLQAIADQWLAKNRGPLSINLVAADADGDPLTFSAQVSIGSGTPPVALSLMRGEAGTQLLISPSNGYSGTFDVVVTVSDGRASATRTFQVTVANSAPVLDAISNQTVFVDGGPVTLILPASDSDGDELTFSGQVIGLPMGAGQGNASLAYQLKQQLGLSYGGSYYANSWGAQEKWLLGANYQWYIVLPMGELRRWSGTLASTLAADALVATLGAAYYDDPSLLWNAQLALSMGAAPASLAFNGNQLTLQPAPGFSGSLVVQVTASDGSVTATQSFTVNVVPYAPPTLSPLANQTVTAGQGPLAVNLILSNPSGLALTCSAQVSGGDSQAYELKQQLGLTGGASGSTNALGLQEKWLLGANYQWYILLPSGELRRWSGTVNATLSATALIATVDLSCYNDPSKLWNAQPIVPATVQVSGNQLVIEPAAGFVGAFIVTVTVSDGITVLTQSYQVTVTS